MENPRTSTPYFISAAVSDSHRYSLTTNVYDSDGNSVPSSPYDAGGNIRTSLLSTMARMNGARVHVLIIAMLELCQPSKSHSPTPPPSPSASRLNDAVLESLKMVFHHSRAFQRPSISDNLVLHQRELARWDDNRIKDEIEIYFNEERPAALPFEILMLFRSQHQWEKSNGHAGTTPPGFAIILNYLQRNVMPDVLTILHHAPGEQTVQDWEIVHRYGYEILSAQQNSSRVTRLLRSPEGTPFHLQAFPPGLNIRPGRNDPLTRHWAVLRNEILTSLRFIHLEFILTSLRTTSR
ncbi:hypothetical protein B0H11DRAFT_1932333 [Mycena galericulata]|nr:hypothetical protein B0H11DRAFT_1932333 [Mycena galericulata]